MQVFHTAGEPPSSGSTILPNIGCTRNSSPALVNTAAVNVASSGSAKPAGARSAGAAAAAVGTDSNDDDKRACGAGCEGGARREPSWAGGCVRGAPAYPPAGAARPREAFHT